MSYSLHRSAERDLTDAFRFYKAEAGRGVAGRFLTESERAVNILEEFPDIGTPTQASAASIHSAAFLTPSSTARSIQLFGFSWSATRVATLRSVTIDRESTWGARLAIRHVNPRRCQRLGRRREGRLAPLPGMYPVLLLRLRLDDSSRTSRKRTGLPARSATMRRVFPLATLGILFYHRQEHRQSPGDIPRRALSDSSGGRAAPLLLCPPQPHLEAKMNPKLRFRESA